MIDFIIKLPQLVNPVTNDKYDLIIVIIDKLTKYAIIILYKESYNASQLGFILLDRLIRDYSIPELITLNRDKLFILNYQKTLIASIRTKLRISIAYYPQTDRQTKRTNQTIEGTILIKDKIIRLHYS